MGIRGLRRLLSLLLLALIASLTFGAVAASADTASLTFSDASGKSDPVVDVGRTATLSGTSASDTNIYLRVRPAGGAACAPSADSDSGKTIDNYFDNSGPDRFDNTEVNGSFTLKKTGNWSTSGDFLFCIWIAKTSSTSSTPISQVISFRKPTGTISATLNPVTPQEDQAAAVTITGASEASERVYATYRVAGGAPCSTSYDADSGRGLVNGTAVSGAFSVPATLTISDPGNYILCLWLASSSNDASPIAGPQSTPFTVAAPPPPCVVPTIAPGTPLASALTLLSSAHCVAGTRRYSQSRTYAKGTIIKTSPTAGTSLANNAPVDIFISTGRPCTVPSAPGGVTLSRARLRLTSAGCKVGKITKVLSSRKKGTLVRYSLPSGTKLGVGATVGIRVSKGRHR